MGARVLAPATSARAPEASLTWPASDLPDPHPAEWIDYNGHLRDAYYVLIVSQATDALMDRIGLDEAYRRRTQCTLYTVELHIPVSSRGEADRHRPRDDAPFSR